MSDNSPFGFGRFVPGFDFLQNLTKGMSTGMPSMPGLSALSGWVAPTMSVEEIDKRVQELKAVQFWLEQNSRALSATVQALEVQKMTLATLQGMNVAVQDFADALKPSPAAAAPTPAPAPTPAAPPAAAPSPAAANTASTADSAASAGMTGLADPMQWWGALTQQFQQIASNAMQDVSTHQAAFEATRDIASGAIKTATDMATDMAAQLASQASQASQGMQAMQGAGAAAAQAAAQAASAAAKSVSPKAAAPKARPTATPAAPQTAAKKPTAASKKAPASKKTNTGKKG